MTFTAIVARVMNFCGLTSTEAQTRVGESVNTHHRRITSELGMDTTRFVTRSDETTVSSRTMTFTNIEKIDRLLDMTGGVRLLTETSMHELR